MKSFVDQLGGLGDAFSTLMADEAPFHFARVLADHLFETQQPLPANFMELLIPMTVAELAGRYGLTQSHIATLVGGYSTTAISQHRSKKGRARQTSLIEESIQAALRTPVEFHIIHLLQRDRSTAPVTTREQLANLKSQLHRLGCDTTCERIEAVLSHLKFNGNIRLIDGKYRVVDPAPPVRRLSPLLEALRSHHRVGYILDQFDKGSRNKTFSVHCRLTTRDAERLTSRLREDRQASSFLKDFDQRSQNENDLPIGYSAGIAIRLSDQSNACDPVDHIRKTPIKEDLIWSVSTVAKSLFEDLFSEIGQLENYYEERAHEAEACASGDSTATRYQLSFVAVELPGDSRF